MLRFADLCLELVYPSGAIFSPFLSISLVIYHGVTAACFRRLLSVHLSAWYVLRRMGWIVDCGLIEDDEDGAWGLSREL